MVYCEQTFLYKWTERQYEIVIISKPQNQEKRYHQILNSNSYSRYKITKDQGNTSGVAKIFLPKEPGNYDIFYIREENNHARILGKYIIKLSPILISSFQEVKVERVHYPAHLQALLKKQGVLFTVQETSSPGRSESIKSSVNHSQLVVDEYPFEIIPKSNMYNKVNPL